MNLAAAIYAILSAVLMGTMGIFSKLTGLPAEVLTFFRLFLGALFMVLLLGVVGKVRLIWKWPSFPVIFNGIIFASGIMLYVQAMNYTTMANAIMIIYLAPLAASVVAHFFLGERLTVGALGLILLALLGFGMMMEFKVDINSDSQEFTGVCYALMASSLYVGFILMSRIINPSIHVYTRTFWQLFTGGLVMIPFVLFSMHEVNMSYIPWLIGVGFFPGFLAILFAIIALSRLPVAIFGTLAYMEPVAVVVFGWTIFQETLNSLQLAGCLLIIFCSVLKTVNTRKLPALERS